MTSGPYGPESGPRPPRWSHLVLIIVIGVVIILCCAGLVSSLAPVDVCCFGQPSGTFTPSTIPPPGPNGGLP